MLVKALEAGIRTLSGDSEKNELLVNVITFCIEALKRIDSNPLLVIL